MAAESSTSTASAASSVLRAGEGVPQDGAAGGVTRIEVRSDGSAQPTRAGTAPQARRAWLRFRSLRTELQLFSLVLVLLPGLLFALITLARVRAALESAAGRQLAEVAHDVLEEIDGTLAAERTTVRTWTRQEVMRDVVIGDLDKRISRFLRSLRDGNGPYLDLACVDGAGRVVAASDPAWIGRDLSAEPWTQLVLAGGEWLRGPETLAGSTGPAVEIAAPIRDQERGGAVSGALLARYDWAQAMKLVSRIRRTLEPHGVRVDVVVADAAGVPLGESWRDGLDPGAIAGLRGAAVHVARRLPAHRRRGWLRVPRAGVLIGYERGEGVGRATLALVLESLPEALTPARELRNRLAFALVAVLCGALVVATILARRMSRPLRALTRATREIALGGEPRRPVPVRSRDEIGQLAAAFNRMAAELRHAQDELLVAAKFAFVGEVAAGVAHEVRTPLGILRSSAQMLGRALRDGQPHSAELAGMMVEEVDRLDRVVAGLLELARPHELLIEPTPLARVLARALDFIEGQAREKGIGLQRALDADSCPARCDPEQIYQVALNLILNALQILPRGGTITVRTVPHWNGHVAFEVRDDGPGIPPELRERVFTPFFTLREGGTGLGLALVQRIVRAHQGTVTIEDTPGGGTTFRVVLPAAGGAS